MRTYSPVRLVTNNSRPYLLSRGARKSPGTLSRPRSSMRAGEFPLNTDKSAIKTHFHPEKSTAIVEKPRAEVNAKGTASVSYDGVVRFLLARAGIPTNSGLLSKVR